MSHVGHIRERENKNGRKRYQIIVEAWKGPKRTWVTD